MATIIDKIFKVINQSDTDIIHIYFNCIDDVNNIIPKLYSLHEIKKIKKNIPISDIKNITYKETFFRDLIKIETSGDIISCAYIKKKMLFHMIDNNILIVLNYIKYIDKQTFPILSNYHNIEIKNINLIELKTIDILIIEKENKNYQLCVLIKNKYDKTLISELSFINVI